MSAVSQRTPAQVDRLARVQSLGGWLLALGLLVAVAAAAAVLAREGAPLGLLSGRAAPSIAATSAVTGSAPPRPARSKAGPISTGTASTLPSTKTPTRQARSVG
ncbi:MAG TPA: hypothetical protein VGL23_12240, partial [Chloroflexota bacterium]